MLFISLTFNFDNSPFIWGLKTLNTRLLWPNSVRLTRMCCGEAIATVFNGTGYFSVCDIVPQSLDALQIFYIEIMRATKF